MTDLENMLLNKTYIAEYSKGWDYDEETNNIHYTVKCGDREIVGIDGIYQMDADNVGQANKAIAERIVACMNFCRGITNQQLRSGMFTIKEL